MNIEGELGKIASIYRSLEQAHLVLASECARLTQQGCLDATEYWREEKYLTLVFPQKGGVRRRDYIGNHPLRIKEARQKLSNYKKRSAIIATQEEVEEKMKQIEDTISVLLSCCEGKRKIYSFDLVASN